jgi:methylmalonyl-CoA/ethylmalonyl-CoA epimerase
MIDPTPSDLGDLVERLDHVALAVADLSSATRLMTVMGATRLDGGDETAKGFRWAQFRLPGEGTIELITPLPSSGPDHFLVKFLAETGDGMHHVTLKVSSLARAIQVMERAGYVVVGVDDSDDSWKEAFVHPKSSHGLLIQLAEWNDSDKAAAKTDVAAPQPDGPGT